MRRGKVGLPGTLGGELSGHVGREGCACHRALHVGNSGVEAARKLLGRKLGLGHLAMGLLQVHRSLNLQNCC